MHAKWRQAHAAAAAPEKRLDEQKEQEDERKMYGYRA